MTKRLAAFRRWVRSPRMICGWCGGLMHFGGPLFFRKPVSHGLCSDCARREMQRARRDGNATLFVAGRPELQLPRHPAPRFSVQLDA
jgi:hypothetical protein